MVCLVLGSALAVPTAFSEAGGGATVTLIEAGFQPASKVWPFERGAGAGVAPCLC